nr:DNA methyltransferase [Merismopedia glauca]
MLWCYRKWSVKQGQFVRNHDVIVFYSKSDQNIFNSLFIPVSEGTMKRWKGKKQQAVFKGGVRSATSIESEESKTPMPDWWDISIINPAAKERLGYPTQKPEALLERIIQASSNEGDIILDAYCGCGTTVSVAQKLNRQWIGIDITYQSISLILKRLEDSFGKDALTQVKLNGIPKDLESAKALATRQDDMPPARCRDRTRKEFEKWAVLSYTNNRATINQKKGSDKGIDGIYYFRSEKNETEKAVIQVKSGKVKSGDIRDLQGTMVLEGAEIGIFITLEEPTKDMRQTAKAAGIYQNKYMSHSCDKIAIVTIQEILEDKWQINRLGIPLGYEVLKSAEKQMETAVKQMELTVL